MFLKQSSGRPVGLKINPRTDYSSQTEGVYEIVEAPPRLPPPPSDGSRFYDPEYIPLLQDGLVPTTWTPANRSSSRCQLATTTGAGLWRNARAGRDRRRRAILVVRHDPGITDVSRRRSLRRNAETLRLTLDATQDGIWNWDLPTDGVDRRRPVLRDARLQALRDSPTAAHGWTSLHPDDTTDGKGHGRLAPPERRPTSASCT